jgi:hypothetical protein
MMRFVSVAILCAMGSTPVFACDRPSAPSSIPDGATASKEDMLAAKKAVDTFKSGIEDNNTTTLDTVKEVAGGRIERARDLGEDLAHVWHGRHVQVDDRKSAIANREASPAGFILQPVLVGRQLAGLGEIDERPDSMRAE